MRRALGLTVALLGLWAPWAQAQVAVPELAPAAVRIYDSRFPIAPMNSLVPENPAAMQWGTPSRVGAGALRGAKSDTFDGKSDSYNGTFGGLRLVGHRLGFGLDTTTLKVKFTGQPRLEKTQTAAALSFSWPETLAFGLATQKLTTDAVSPGGIEQKIEFSGSVAGVSWRLGEHFFLGGAYGSEDVESKIPPLPDKLNRKHYMAGLGLRGGGSIVWRIEADAFHRDDLKDPFSLVVLPGYDLNQASLEAIWGSWLFGATGYQVKPTQNQGNISGYSLDFGLAPLSGLTLTWRFEHSERKDAFGSALSKEEINNAAVTWEF